MQIFEYLFTDDGSIPNSHLPLLVYSKAFEFGGGDPASTIERLFSAHGWPQLWRNGIYSYHHYHSTSHEILGCYRGHAEVLFGGERGKRITFTVGDVVLIPAGVGHFNKGCSDDFRVVGGYPSGSICDMQYGRPNERPEVLENIASLNIPPQDPVLGLAGGLRDIWL